jgi:hypothetical protein
MNSTGQGDDMSGQAHTMMARLPGVVLLLSVFLPAQAGWEFPEFTARSLSQAGLDRAFECQVQQLVDEHADRLQGADVVVTRFGNTIVITGQAQDAGGRARIDKLVLDAAGISREQVDAPTVVPAKTRGCEGRALAANTKRKSILKTNRDCSSLRVDDEPEAETKGQVYNHVGLASPDPAMQLARQELLAAQARLSLLDNGVINAMDRSLIRLVAQDGVIYVLGNMDAARQSEIRVVLMKISGVDAVQFYSD